MFKCFILSFAVISLVMMGRPACVLADTNTKIQQDQNQLQSDMIQQSKEHMDYQGLENKKAEVYVKKEGSPSPSEGPSFKVNKIILEGNTVFSTKLLRRFVKPYEGRVLYFKDLDDLALLITSYYVSEGYLTSEAYVPPQKISDGKVIIRIMEAVVGNIKIQGNRWFSDTLYLDKINLWHGEILNVKPLAMSLQEINELPDRTVKAYLEPGETLGTSDVVIHAHDQAPYHASYEYNNQGTQLTHFSRNILHLTDNNFTGHGDSLQTSVSFADQNSLLGGMFQYLLPRPLQGLTYSFNAGYDYSRLEKDLRPLKVTSTSFFISPGVTKNFIKLPGFNLDGYMGFEIKDAKTLVDQNKLSLDRSRVLDIGPRVAIDDNWGKTFVAGDLRGGIPDILDGSELHDPEASRIRSGGEFVYFTSSVDRINQLPFGTYLVLHGSGQYSPFALTSLEQFYLGGMNSVRGYAPSDSSGDSGVNFSAEFRIPPYFIPSQWRVWKSKDKTWRDTLSIVTFVDGGRTFNYYRQDINSAKDRTLLSTGIGLRYYLSPDINCQIGIGFPFGDTPSSGNKHDQVYISARVGF